MPKRIKGASVKTVIDDREVEVVFQSPYRWRIYEGDREVTREFGFDGQPLKDDERLSAFHAKVRDGEKSCRLQVDY